MKRTYQPKKRQEQKEHGFMKRMKTRAGRNILKARRAKGRKKIKRINISPQFSGLFRIIISDVNMRKIKTLKKKL